MTSPVGLWFDWSGAGFGSTAYDDCTQYLRAIRYQRGGSADITGASQAGGASIVLRNPDGLFDPDNASGPLYGYLHDGVRVWFGANEDGTISGAGTVRGRFAGRTVDVSPLPAPGAGSSTPEVEITCEDAKAWYGRTPVSLSVASVPADLIPPLPVPAPSIVNWQWLYTAIGTNPTSYALTFSPASGNTLVVIVAVRNGFYANAVKNNNSGGSSYSSLQVNGNPGNGNDGIGAWSRAADGTETALYFDLPSGAGGNSPIGWIVELAGVTSLSSALTASSSGTTLTGPAVTPTSGHGAIVLGAWAQGQDVNATQTAGAGWTYLDSLDHEVPPGGFHPHVLLVYKSIASASGSYSPAGSSTISAGWMSISVAGVS